MYSILKNANKEQLVLFTTSGLCFLAGPGRKAGSVGNSSSCLGSHGDSGVAGLFPGPGEKAKGGVRKIVRTLVSPSGVLLSVLNGCCCPQLALSSRLYRSAGEVRSGAWWPGRSVSPDVTSGSLVPFWHFSPGSCWSFPASSCFGEGWPLCLLLF